MGASSKMRWQRYVRELRFIHEEADFIVELSRAIGPEFQEFYEKYCIDEGIELSVLNQQRDEETNKSQENQDDNRIDNDSNLNSGVDSALVIHDPQSQECVNRGDEGEYAENLSDYQMTKDEIEIHDSFTKVFRKLAMILHPDKLDKSLSDPEHKERLEMFQQSKSALEERKYFTLLDYAERFKITAPKNYNQQVRWMKKEIDKMEEENKKQKSTYNYLFSECETDSARSSLIKRFMTQIFGPEIFTNNA